MIILRDGKAYELTSDEIYEAYREQELIYDIDDVYNELEAIVGADVDEKAYVDAARRVLASNDLLREAAYQKRRNMDKYCLSWHDATIEAVKDIVCREMRYDDE